MNKLFAATLLGVLSVGTAVVAQAQTGPAFPERGQNRNLEATRSNATNAQELARNQRRAAMSPDEIKKDQQLALLEARTGNTSFGGHNGPERQFDSNRPGNGFMVRKFKAKAGFGEGKRGMSHPIGGANPAGKPGYAEGKRGQGRFIGGSNPDGKPLVHKHKSKHRFLFF